MTARCANTVVRTRFIVALNFFVLLSAPLVTSAQEPTTEAGAEFNVCLNALDGPELHDPGFAAIEREFQTAPEYQQAKWNVNKPYQAGAFNLLLPSWTAGPWPSALCGSIPKEPADCATSTRDKFIICNPALGREFASPLLQSGIGSMEVEFATKFILLTLIGHELGHIRIHSSDEIRHLLPQDILGGMNCFKRVANEETEEEAADRIGVAIACAAVRKDPELPSLPQDPGGVLQLISRLEDSLDEAYFKMDDVCRGDKDYPSTSRRKGMFVTTYLDCLYPATQPVVKALAEEGATSVKNLEEWLDNRQMRGQLSSPTYGKSAQSSGFTAPSGTENGYLTFDSSDVESSLWFVHSNQQSRLQYQLLEHWPAIGQVVSLDVGPDQRTMLIELSPSGERDTYSGVEVSIKCGVDSCFAQPKSIDLPAETHIVRSGEQVFLISPTAVARLETIDDLFNGKSIPWSQHKLGDDAFPVFGDPITGVFGKGKGGIYNLALSAGGRSKWKVLFAVPNETGILESALVAKGRLLLVFYDTPLAATDTLSLWDCPTTPLTASSKTIEVQCVAYSAPAAIATTLATATRDLAAIQDRKIELDSRCGDIVVVHHLGWLWLLNRETNASDLLPADGLISCDLPAASATTFRARRIDEVRLEMKPVTKFQASLSVVEAGGSPNLKKNRSGR